MLPGNSHGLPELYWKIMVCCQPLNNRLRIGFELFKNRRPPPKGSSHTVPIFKECGRSKAYTLRWVISRCVSTNAVLLAPMKPLESVACSMAFEYVYANVRFMPPCPRI